MICNEGHNGLVLQVWMEIFVLLPNHFGGEGVDLVAILLFVVILFEIGLSLSTLDFSLLTIFHSLDFSPKKIQPKIFKFLANIWLFMIGSPMKILGLKIWAT
jgi:hypothetical protein